MSSYRCRALAFILALLGGTGSVGGPPRSSQANPTSPAARWETNGPDGGLVFRVQVAPGRPERVLVTTCHGHWLTGDGGQSWSRVERPGRPSAMPVLLHRGALWCEDRQRLLRSGDDGRTWQDRGFLGGQLLGVATVSKLVDVWAGITPDAKLLMVTAWKGLLVPRDVAPTTASTPGESDGHLFASHPDAPQHLLLAVPDVRQKATWFAGSDDGGSNWDTWKLPGAVVATCPQAGNPKAWLALVQGALLRSTDGGRTWTRRGEDRPPLPELRSLAPVPGTSRVLLGTVGGKILELAAFDAAPIVLDEGRPEDAVIAIAIASDHPDRLFAGTQGGLYVTGEGGRPWRWAAGTISACQSTALFAVGGEKVLLFEYQQGIRVSEDAGRSWRPYDPAAKATVGKPGEAIGAGERLAYDGSFPDGWRILTTVDGGRTWRRADLDGECWLLGVSPGGFYACGKDKRLRRSADGVQFTSLPPLSPAIEGDPLRMLECGPAGTWIVTDKVIASFDPATGRTGPATAIPGKGPEWSFAPQGTAADPVDSETIWVVCRGVGLARRRLPAGPWVPAIRSADAVSCGMVADPGRKTRLITVFSDGSLYTSDDSGTAWRPFTPSPGLHVAQAIAVTPGRVLLVAGDGGVHRFPLAALDD